MWGPRDHGERRFAFRNTSSYDDVYKHERALDNINERV